MIVTSDAKCLILATSQKILTIAMATVMNTLKIYGTNGRPMTDNIGLDTLISTLAPLLLKKQEYALSHLGPNPYMSSFSGYSLGKSGSPLDSHTTAILTYDFQFCQISCILLSLRSLAYG